MASDLIDKNQLAVLLCQQVFHGGDPEKSTDCPRDDREGEIERAAKLIRMYADVPRAGKAAKTPG